jgi:hypothetical protein
MIEVYWPTGLEHPQPFVQVVDLTKSEEELQAESKAMTDLGGDALLPCA